MNEYHPTNFCREMLKQFMNRKIIGIIIIDENGEKWKSNGNVTYSSLVEAIQTYYKIHRKPEPLIISCFFYCDDGTLLTKQEACALIEVTKQEIDLSKLES